MRKRIFWAMLACSIAVLAAAVLLLAGVLFVQASNAQRNLLEGELELAAQGTALGGLTYLEGFADAGFRLTWIAPDGTVLYDTKSEARTMDNHAGREEISSALASGSGASSRMSDTLLERTVYLAARLPDGSILRIAQALVSFPAVLLDALPSFLILIVCALGLSAALAASSAKRLVEPLNSMNLADPIQTEVYPELTPLTRRLHDQQLRIRQQMRELETRADELQQIMAGMSEGLILIDAEGRILQINAAAKAVYGVDDAVLGRPLQEVDRDTGVKEALQAALQEGAGYLRKTRNGRHYQVRISAMHAGDTATGAVVLIFDDTERVLSEQWRQEFSANASHELKTPLQSIIGSAELLDLGIAAPEDVPRFLGRIRSESERLRNLVQDILFLSQLDEGAHMEREPLDLLTILQEAAARLEPEAAKKQVVLTVSGSSTLVVGVRAAIEEMISNLVDNAVRYNVVGGSVDARAFVEDEHPVLEIRDTGIGIPGEYQERVFERFFRVDKSRSRESGGTGLGLSIVKHSAALHSAEIRLASSSNGTCVSVRFPARAPNTSP